MSIAQLVHQERNKYIASYYYEPVGVIMTPRQRHDLMADEYAMHYFQYSYLNKCFGLIMHIERKELDMSNWLHYNQYIDIRSYDESVN